MEVLFIYIITIVLLIISFFKDYKKSLKALKKSWKALENILPQFITVIIIVAISMAVLNPEEISKFIGKTSGWLGVLSAAIIGSVTLIPGFIAFPVAAELLRNGAGIMQIAAFVSTLMMVGIVTLPLEISYFGKRFALMRNISAFAFSILVAVFVSWVVTL